MDGVIHKHLQGRTIAAAFKDGDCLIIQCIDGHEIKIGWADANGDPLKGEPVFRGQGVKIQLASVGMSGAVGNF